MRLADGSVPDQGFVVLIGAVLLVASIVGVVHGTRAAMGQRLYYEAKYGQGSNDVDRLVACCHRAYAWYSWNYRFSIEAAERAYAAGVAGDRAVSQDYLRQSELWCERGLLQNPWKSQLRRLKTRFLWKTSPLAAVRYWEEHTRWQFWDPYNHAVLAELYAQAAWFDKAQAELKWTEGTAEYESARARVAAEKAKWDEVLSPDG